MRKIKIKIKVKATDESKLPDWGLGKGILAEQEIELLEEVTESNKIRLAYKIDEIYQDLLESNFDKIIEVID
jgi:hypothetical protein